MKRRRSRLLGAARGKFGYLLLALIAFLATAPVIVDAYGWQLVLAGFGSGVIVAGLHAARPGRLTLVVGVIVAAVEYAIGRMVDLSGSTWLICVQALVWMIALTYVAFEILEWVLDNDEVTLETIQAAFCVYLLIGLIWAFLFALVNAISPASFQTANGPVFKGMNAASQRLVFLRLFIFSYSRMTGTGYADITPVGGFASMAACLEAMMSRVYLAVVIARLVGRQSATPRSAAVPITSEDSRAEPSL